MSKTIFYLEDHDFFADIIIRGLEMEGYTVYHCNNYYDAEKYINKYGPFQYSILDIILKNGKNGINFAEKHHDKLGKFIFLTGCKDESTIRTLTMYNYPSLSKMYEVMEDLVNFIEKEQIPMIPLNEVC